MPRRADECFENLLAAGGHPGLESFFAGERRYAVHIDAGV